MQNYKTFITFIVLLFVLFQGIFNQSPQNSPITNLPTPSPNTASSSGVLGIDESEHLVMKVIDGDTIEIENGKKVRLIGINTPEIHDPRKGVECFGKEASEKTKELLGGKEIFLEPDSSQTNMDRYGRLLRYVFLPDGTNINKKLIELGYAYEYTYDNPYKYQKEFVQAQKQAAESKSGLWAQNTCNGELK